jgi:hypothetical protein
MQWGPLEDPQESIDVLTYMKKRLIRSRTVALSTIFVCFDSTTFYLAYHPFHPYNKGKR